MVIAIQDIYQWHTCILNIIFVVTIVWRILVHHRILHVVYLYVVVCRLSETWCMWYNYNEQYGK